MPNTWHLEGKSLKGLARRQVIVALMGCGLAAEKDLTKAERTRIKYHLPYIGHVCKPVFKKYFGVGDDYLQSCMDGSVSKRTITIPRHGNCGNQHNVDKEKRAAIEAFLKHARDQQGEAYAMRVRKIEMKDGTVTKTVTKRDIILLPCSLSIKRLWNIFNTAQKNSGKSHTSRATFRSVWLDHEELKDMIVRSPSSDECEICVAHRHLRVTGRSTEEEDECQRRCFEAHQEFYRALRLYYEEDRFLAQESAVANDGAQSTLSIDFAQSLEIPYQPQQIGPFYFLCPYKVFPFGIVDEGTDIGHILCYGEDVQGKGGNQVVSLLFYYLREIWSARQRSPPPKLLALWADNCAGQNKNKTMMWFLAWMVQQPWSPPRVRLCFQVKGHTRNSVDRHFADMKREYLRHGNWKPEDTLEHIANSTADGKNVPVNLFDKKAEGVFRDWDKKLSPFMVPVTAISSYQIFGFDREHPGVCFAKKEPLGPETRLPLCSKKVVGAEAALSDPALPPAMPLLGLKPEKRSRFYESFVDYLPSDRPGLEKEWLYQAPDEATRQIAKNAQRERAEGRKRLEVIGQGGTLEDTNKKDNQTQQTLQQQQMAPPPPPRKKASSAAPAETPCPAGIDRNAKQTLGPDAANAAEQQQQSATATEMQQNKAGQETEPPRMGAGVLATPMPSKRGRPKMTEEAKQKAKKAREEKKTAAAKAMVAATGTEENGERSGGAEEQQKRDDDGSSSGQPANASPKKQATTQQQTAASDGEEERGKEGSRGDGRDGAGPLEKPPTSGGTRAPRLTLKVREVAGASTIIIYYHLEASAH